MAGRDDGTLHFKNAAAFFITLGMPVVEHHAIARFQWRIECQPHRVAFDPSHFPKINAAFFSETRMNKFLVVDASKPASWAPVSFNLRFGLPLLVDRSDSWLASHPGLAADGGSVQETLIRCRCSSSPLPH